MDINVKKISEENDIYEILEGNKVLFRISLKDFVLNAKDLLVNNSISDVLTRIGFNHAFNTLNYAIIDQEDTKILIQDLEDLNQLIKASSSIIRCSDSHSSYKSEIEHLDKELDFYKSEHLYNKTKIRNLEESMADLNKLLNVKQNEIIELNEKIILLLERLKSETKDNIDSTSCKADSREVEMKNEYEK